MFPIRNIIFEFKTRWAFLFSLITYWTDHILTIILILNFLKMIVIELYIADHIIRHPEKTSLIS